MADHLKILHVTSCVNSSLPSGTSLDSGRKETGLNAVMLPLKIVAPAAQRLETLPQGGHQGPGMGASHKLVYEKPKTRNGVENGDPRNNATKHAMHGDTPKATMRSNSQTSSNTTVLPSHAAKTVANVIVASSSKGQPVMSLKRPLNTGGKQSSVVTAQTPPGNVPGASHDNSTGRDQAVGRPVVSGNQQPVVTQCNPKGPGSAEMPLPSRRKQSLAAFSGSQFDHIPPSADNVLKRGKNKKNNGQQSAVESPCGVQRPTVKELQNFTFTNKFKKVVLTILEEKAKSPDCLGYKVPVSSMSNGGKDGPSLSTTALTVLPASKTSLTASRIAVSKTTSQPAINTSHVTPQALTESLLKVSSVSPATNTTRNPDKRNSGGTAGFTGSSSVSVSASACQRSTVSHGSICPPIPTHSSRTTSAGRKEFVCIDVNKGGQGVTLTCEPLGLKVAHPKPMIIEEGTSDQVFVINNKVPDMVPTGNKPNATEGLDLGLRIANIRCNVPFEEPRRQEDRDCFIISEDIKSTVKQEKADPGYDKAALATQPQSNQEIPQSVSMGGMTPVPKVIRVFPMHGSTATSMNSNILVSNTPGGMNIQLVPFVPGAASTANEMSVVNLGTPPLTSNAMPQTKPQNPRKIRSALPTARDNQSGEMHCLSGLPKKMSTPVRQHSDMVLMQKALLDPYHAASPPPELELPVERHTCRECGDSFLFARSLDDHMARSSVRLSFHCPDCERINVVNNLCALKSHIRSHKPHLGFTMDICKHVKCLTSRSITEMKFTEHPALKTSPPSPSDLSASVNASELLHTESSAFFAALYSGSIPDSIWRVGEQAPSLPHQTATTPKSTSVSSLLHSSAKFDQEPPQAKPPAQGAGPRKCLVCQVWCLTGSHFIKDNHENLDLETCEICAWCRELLPNRCMRVAHEGMHGKTPTMCPECGTALTGAANADRLHVEMRCLAAARCFMFSCYKCAARMRSIRQFARHLLMLTTAYQCKYCTFKCETFEKLPRHCKAKHRRPIPESDMAAALYKYYECPFCCHTFGHLPNAIKHMIDLHNSKLLSKGMFVFQCFVDSCDKVYPQKSLLEMHLQLSHGQENVSAIKRNKCPTCSANFKSSYELDAHFTSRPECLQQIPFRNWAKDLLNQIVEPDDSEDMTVDVDCELDGNGCLANKSCANPSEKSKRSGKKHADKSCDDKKKLDNPGKSHGIHKCVENNSLKKSPKNKNNSPKIIEVPTNFETFDIDKMSDRNSVCTETANKDVTISATDAGNRTVKQEPVNRCLACRLNFGNHGDYLQHLSSAHGIVLPALMGDPPEEEASEGATSPSKAVFRCTVCEQVLSGMAAYGKHLEGKHGLYLSGGMLLQHRVPANGSLPPPDGSLPPPDGSLPLPDGSRPSPDGSPLAAGMPDSQGNAEAKPPGEDQGAPSDTPKRKLNRTRQVEVELPRPFPCSHCDNRYTTGALRDRHELLKHAVAPQFPCHLCGMTYPDTSALQEHQANKHQGRGTANNFSCLLCTESGQTKSYTKQVWLVRHLMSAHKIQKAELTSTRVWELTVAPCCPTEDSEPDCSPVKRLKLDGEQVFRCCRCDFIANVREEFSSHITCHLSDTEAQQCLECGMCFSTKPSLKRHLFMVHRIKNFSKYQSETGFDINKPVETDLNRAFYQASEAFRRRSPAQSPVKSASGQNPLECQVCYKVLPDASTLAKHGRTHGMAFIRSKRN